MTFTRSLSTNNYGPAKFIVDGTTTANGTHSTIAAALTSASSGDTIFVRPGTYTENLTLKAGVGITTFAEDIRKVIIVGKCTFTGTGTATISNIQLQTNSDFCLAVTGTLESAVILNDCFINATNNTAISHTSSSASSSIQIRNCTGDLATTGIAAFASTSAGGIVFYYSVFANSGNSVTASTITTGTCNCYNSLISFAMTTSSVAAFGSFYTNHSNGSQNLTMLTLGGSGNHELEHVHIGSGTSAAISIGSAAIISHMSINSTNATAVITGAGAISYSGITFVNTGNIINVTTQTVSGTLQGSRNTAPTAGYLGEQIISNVAIGSPVTMTSNVAKDITSISLTAGVWSVTAIIGIQGVTTGTYAAVSISLVSNTSGTAGDNEVQITNLSNSNNHQSFALPNYRLVLSATTTVYMVGYSLHSAGTGTMFGRLSATRVG